MSTFVSLLNACPNATQIVKRGCDLAEVTSDKDVEILKQVCCAVIIVVGIVVFGFLAWKSMELIAKRCQDKRKRLWEVEDRDKKQKADLLEKLLSFQQKRCEYLADANGKRIDKDKNLIQLDDNAAKDYVDLLKAHIDGKKIPESPTSTGL